MKVQIIALLVLFCLQAHAENTLGLQNRAYRRCRQDGNSAEWCRDNLHDLYENRLDVLSDPLEKRIRGTKESADVEKPKFTHIHYSAPSSESSASSQ